MGWKPETAARRAARRAQLLVLVVAGALLLAACSSARPAASRPGSTSSTTSSSTTTSTTVVPPPASEPTSTSTSTSIAAVAICSNAQLHLGEDTAKSSIGAGSADIALTVSNSAATPCSIEGYPTVSFYAAAAGGSPLPIATRQTGQAPAPVTVDAGGAAAFYLVVGNVPVAGVGCTTVRSIGVTLPSSSVALPLELSLEPCGGAVGVTALEPLASLST
jgi:putative hemolysin